MAVKLVLEFKDADGDMRKWIFNNASNSAMVTHVKALMQGMITNGSIYAHPPVKAVAAYLLTTSQTDYNISD